MSDEPLPEPPFRSAVQAGRQQAAIVAKTGLWVAVITGVLFTVVPSLDPAVSRLFLDDSGRFVLNAEPWKTVRWIFLRGFLVWYVVMAICTIFSATSGRTLLGLTFPKWLYLTLCSLLGPYLTANVWLKEEWGRWRPREIFELGGGHEYTPPLDITGTCADNCSFVSGEVSTTVMVFISLALISSRWRSLFFLLAGVLGALSALIRIGQGGHFLSDTLFAGSFMMLIAAGIFWAMFLGSKPLADDDSVNWSRLVVWHDMFFQSLADWGLRLLDTVAPRR